jgi:hypothetical protein
MLLLSGYQVPEYLNNGKITAGSGKTSAYLFFNKKNVYRGETMATNAGVHEL